jgi:outer membrane protein
MKSRILFAAASLSIAAASLSPAAPARAQAAAAPGAPGVLAPPGGAVERLTLVEAEAAALKSEPAMLAAQDESAAALELLREARAPYYPLVNGEVTGSLGNKDARIGAGALTASRLFNREGQGLVLSQLITDSGRTPNLVATSRSHAGAAEETYQATRAEVLLAVDRAYFDALDAQALIKVAQETVAARQTVTDQVTEMARNKLKSDLDVSFAGVNLAEARLLLLRSQAQYGGALDELARAMGLRQPANWQLAEPPLPPTPGADAEAMVAQALKDRPDLLSLRLESESLHHFEQAERDLARPVVSLVGTAGYMPFIGPDAATVPDHYEGAAINIEVPLLNGHLFAARRAAAHDRALEADQRVRALEDAIARDVRGAWAGATTAYQSLAVTADYLRQATLAMSLAQGRYNLGLSSIVELTQAQLNLTQAEIADLSARYDYQNQHAALRYTLGELH